MPVRWRRPWHYTIRFKGEDEQEVGIVEKISGDKVRCITVKVDPRSFRPTEVETLSGDPTKAREKLGGTPTITLQALVAEMVVADYTSAQRNELVKSAEFQAFDYHE